MNHSAERYAFHGVHVTMLALALSSSLHLGCMGSRGGVIGAIPPSTFQFHNVVPHAGPGEGGWKVAQVNVLLGRLSPIFPEASYCDIEVGVPAVTWEGPVTDLRAQKASALAANNAAREVLSERLVTAVLCDQFRNRMTFLMADDRQAEFLPGARVTRFRPWNVPIQPVTFP